MKGFLIVIGIGALLISLSVLGFVCHIAGTAGNFVGGAVDNAGQVAKKEFYPDALLRKYEWFKDASAQLDKKQADIQIYTNKVKDMHKEYEGTKRKDWDRTDKETFSVWEQELAGIRASYNGLASEYNAQMSKFNYKFCNIGECPPGSTNPLPREYKPYEE